MSNEKDLMKCFTVCDKILKCGHKCSKYCHQDCIELNERMINLGYKNPCKEYIKKTLKCGHFAEIECGR